MKVYLAGPISGLDYQRAVQWRAEVNLRLCFKDRFQIVDPMRGKEFLVEEKDLSPLGYDDHPTSNGQAILRRDSFDIAGCDLLLCNLRGAERVSVGTVAELGMAYALRKYVVLVMEKEGNVHDHCFVRQIASVILPTVDEAVRYIWRTFE